MGTISGVCSNVLSRRHSSGCKVRCTPGTNVVGNHRRLLLVAGHLKVDLLRVEKGGLGGRLTGRESHNRKSRLGL